MKQHVLHPPAFIYFVERETRLELATLALARRCSTTELLQLTSENLTKTQFSKEVERNVPLFVPLSQIGGNFFLVMVQLLEWNTK